MLALYVRASDAATAKRLLDEYPSARTEPGTQFYEVVDHSFRFEPPESELLDLSARLRTVVIWLAFQSVVDAFQFHHWRDGVHLRSLVNGCKKERTWERIEGTPEPWEYAAIIAPEPTAVGLLEGDDETPNPESEPEFKFAEGEFYALDARETARAVATFYCLPGWSDDWRDETSKRQVKS